MEGLFEKEALILPSMCDYSGRLGTASCLDTFMDIAAQHAEILGCGQGSLIMNGRFWLTLKTRVTFFRMPEMNERVTVATWPEPPERMFCIRNYALKQGGQTLALGKTQWAVLNRATGRLDRPTGVYPEDIEFAQAERDDMPFENVTDSMFTGEPFAEYRIKSTDIDIGNHMNNVAYLRAFESLFSVAERREKQLKTVEIHFRNQCFEGEVLSFTSCDSEGKTFVRARVGDRTAVFITLQFR